MLERSKNRASAKEKRKKKLVVATLDVDVILMELRVKFRLICIGWEYCPLIDAGKKKHKLFYHMVA